VTIYLSISDCGEEDESAGVGEELVSRGDAAELFELVEEALDEIALFVERLVIFDWRAAASRSSSVHSAGRSSPGRTKVRASNSSAAHVSGAPS
jgi:hypothetical protein